MIEKMKKVTIFSLKDRKQSTIEELRNCGLMHIESIRNKSEGGLAEEKRKEELLTVLSEIEEVKEKKDKSEKKVLSTSFEKEQEALFTLSNEKKKLSEEMNRLQLEKERLEAFGNLEPSLVSELENDGLKLHFYTMSDKDLRMTLPLQRREHLHQLRSSDNL